MVAESPIPSGQLPHIAEARSRSVDLDPQIRPFIQGLLDGAWEIEGLEEVYAAVPDAGSVMVCVPVKSDKEGLWIRDRLSDLETCLREDFSQLQLYWRTADVVDDDYRQ